MSKAVFISSKLFNFIVEFRTNLNEIVERLHLMAAIFKVHNQKGTTLKVHTFDLRKIKNESPPKKYKNNGSMKNLSRSLQIVIKHNVYDHVFRFQTVK